MRLRRRPHSREGYHNLSANEESPITGPRALVYQGSQDFAWFRYEFTMANSGGTSVFAVDIETDDLREMVTALAQYHKADELTLALGFATMVEKLGVDLKKLEQQIEALMRTASNLEELVNEYRPPVAHDESQQEEKP